MADLIITAANVKEYTDPTPEIINGRSGEALTAGQSVYKKNSDGKYYRGDANDTSDTADMEGIAMNNCPGADQPIAIFRNGDIDLGATLAVGTIYILSGNPGGIAPAADLTSGWRTTIIGVAKASNKLRVTQVPGTFNSDAQVP